MDLLVSKKKNVNAMDRYIKECYLLQRKCLGRIAMKASESAYPTNVLGSIVLLMSLLKVLINNMFDVSYVSYSAQYHRADEDKVTVTKVDIVFLKKQSEANTERESYKREKARKYQSGGESLIENREIQ
ncbi:hypothetical protein YC2023_076280 [Brassica napus]